jgi:hypothetical protein
LTGRHIRYYPAPEAFISPSPIQPGLERGLYLLGSYGFSNFSATSQGDDREGSSIIYPHLEKASVTTTDAVV